MKTKAVSGIMLTLLLTSMLTLAFNIQPAKASGTIYIRADGSIEPSTANITSTDNVTYYFTDNNYDEIVVERNNIVVDGAGYTVQGKRVWESKGISLSGRSNVTTKNMEIKAFWYGIWLEDSSSYNSISGNNITNNKVGIWLYESSNNIISGNNITANKDYGIYLDYSSNNSIHGNNITTNNYYGIYLSRSSNNNISGNTITNTYYGIRLRHSSNNIIYHNNFIDNTQQVYIYPSGYTNVWDDGYPSGGNYWSDYAGVDSDHDGIGDTPCVIDKNNQDNYPLMSPCGLVEEEEEGAPFWMQWWFWTIIATVIVASAGVVYFLKKRKTPTAPLPSIQD